MVGIPSILVLLACADGVSGDDTATDNFSWIDTDGDTILDVHEGFSAEPGTDEDGNPIEGEVDTDGDGDPDHNDPDSDGDGIADRVEAGDLDPLTLPFDSDSDGIGDWRDLDSDDNCIGDADEGGDDLDGDGVPDFADLDDDGDGIKDSWEIGDECAAVDSDGDGTPDYQDLDSDGDGIGDVWEAGTSTWQDEPRDTDGDGVYDYLDDDSDGDGFSDAEEGGVSNPGTEPQDTDGDGIYDFYDFDSDGDGLSDAAERDVYGTDPYSADTDGDGFSDGAEAAAGTNPRDANDIIEGLYVTVGERDSVEEIFDFTLNIQMGDIAFLLDTTGSMYSTKDAMASEFSNIVSQLNSRIPDAEYGVATYDDYAYGGYGSSAYGDKPFELRQQITSDVSRVQSVLSSIPLHGGSDGPESGMEALYQGLTGVGYDQNCNGSYQSTTDVKPFISGGGDPFGGSGGQFQTSGSGGGDVGGYGFRAYSLPVIVYATDNYLRDPDSGYGSPGGCPGDAGKSDVIAAAGDIGAYLVGIGTQSSLPISQMNQLSSATGSLADTDGDGAADDRLVFQWSGSSSSLRTTIVNAIEDLISSVKFSTVELVVNDPYGFVTSVDPATYSLSGAVNGQRIQFTLDFRGVVAASDEDQVYTLTLDVVGDGSILLDTLDIYVLVPGTSY